MNFFHRYSNWLEEEVPSQSFCLFRSSLGVFVFATAIRLMIEAPLYFVKPAIELKYPSFSWWPHPSEMINLTLCYLLLVAGVGLTLGAYVRFAVCVAIGIILHFFIQDASFYLNDLVLLAVLLAPFLVYRAKDSFSIERKGNFKGEARFKNIRKKRENRIPRYRIVLFIAIFYTGYLASAAEKFRSDWFNGRILDVSLGMGSELNPAASVLFHLQAGKTLAFLLFFSELFIPIGMSIRSLKRMTFLILLIYHAFQFFVLRGGPFQILWGLGSILYFEPSWPKIIFQRLSLRSQKNHPT